MTYGHELREGENVGGREGAGQRGIEGEKWDNCNSMICKIYFKNKNMEGMYIMLNSKKKKMDKRLKRNFAEE